MAGDKTVEEISCDFVATNYELKLTLDSNFEAPDIIYARKEMKGNGAPIFVRAQFVAPDEDMCTFSAAICVHIMKKGLRIKASVTSLFSPSPIDVKISRTLRLTEVFKIAYQDVIGAIKRSGGQLEIVIRISIREVLPPLDEGEESISKCFTEMLQSGEFSDFEVVCQERTFKCHKNVLAARSEYFRIMLKSAYKEAQENRIVVNEVDNETMETVLHFIYSGEFDKGKASVDVLGLAHLYGLRGLFRRCCNELAFGIDMETIYEILPAAYVLDREFLFKHALAFFKRNKKQIMESEDWEQLASNAGLVDCLGLAD